MELRPVCATVVLAVVPTFQKDRYGLVSRFLTLAAIVLIAVAGFALRSSGDAVFANGATRLIVKDAEVGPYIIRVGILPGSPKVGLLHLSILVQDAAGAVAVTDATVLMTATSLELRSIECRFYRASSTTSGSLDGVGPGGGTVQVQAFNTPQSPQLYEGNVPLDALGSWILTLDMDGPLGRGSLDVPLRVTESGGFNLLFVIIGAAAVLIVVSLVWSQRQRSRRSNSKPTRN